MLIPLILTVLGGIYFWMKWRYSYWERLGVPSPTPSLLVGNIGPVLCMKIHFGELALKWYKQYSDIPYFGYYKALTPAVMVRDPELIRNILIRDQTSFNANDFGFDEKLDPLLAHNPFMVTGDKWKLSRGLLSPLFTANKVKNLFPLMVSQTQKLTEYIKQKGSSTDCDAKNVAIKFTTENVAFTSFSLDAHCFEETQSEFIIMGKKIFEPTIIQAIKMTLLMFLPWTMNLIPIAFLPKDVDIWIRNLVKQNVDSRKISKPTHDDLLQMLLSLKEKNSLTDEQITGHALSFFSEGAESSSTLLCFAMYEMGLNQDLQEVLREEVTEVLERYNGELTYDAIQEMSYLDAIMHETLRMRPVALTLQKTCTKPYEFPLLSGQTKPCIIPKGCPVTVNIYSLHMDPEYFPDPEVFDPERFNEEQKNKYPKGVYMPFGEGPRMCMGFRFALTQTKAALATIILNFNIKVSPNCKPLKIDPKSFLYQTKDKVLLNFIPRNLK